MTEEIISERRAEPNPFETPQDTSHGNDTDVIRDPTTKSSLIALYVLAAVSGATQVFDNQTAYYLVSLLLAFAATTWAVVDTRIRGGRFLGILRLVYFLVWPVASLVYLIATRKSRGLFWWGLNAVGLYVSVAVTFYLTFSLLYFTGRTDLIDPTLLY